MKCRWTLALVLLVGCKRPQAPPGCFNVQGFGDAHASLQDAIDAADAGDTISVCGGPSSGEVVIEKDLKIEGQEDSDSVFFSEGDAFTIRNADVTLERVIIRAVGSGVQVFDGSLTFQGGEVDESGGIGIDAYDSDVLIRYAEIEDSPLGGMRLEGGTLDMNHVDLARLASFGVLLNGGVTATIEDSTFEDIYYTGNASYLFTADGIGVQTIRQDDVTLTANKFSNCSIAAVQVESGKVRMDGDEIVGGYVGVLTLGTEVTMNDVIVTPQRYGVYGRVSTLDLTNTTLAVDPEGDTSSIPVVALGSDVSITGGSVTGGNYGGLMARALNEVTIPDVFLEGTLFDNNAICAVSVETGKLTANDTTISNTRDRDDACDPTTTICNAAICLSEASATWTGGAITDFGSTAVYMNAGRFDAVGATIARGDGGVLGIDSGVLFDGVTVEDTGAYGVSATGGTVDVRNTSFSGNVGTTVYSEVHDDLTTHSWETTGGGVDVYVEQAPAVLEAVTCTDGDRGVVTGASASAQLTDVTFTDYAQQVMATEGGTIDALRVTATDTGGDAIVCTDGEVTLEKVTLDGVNTWVADTTYSIDGVLQSTSSEVHVDPALRGLRCRLTAEDVSMSDVAGQPARWWNGIFEAEGLIVDGALSGVTDPSLAAIELAWTERAPAAVIEDATIEGLYHGDGISIAVSAALEPGFVELADVTVATPPGDGLSLTGGTPRLSGVTVTDAGQYGMTCDTAVPPAFPACEVSLDGAMGDARDCSGCP